MHTPQIYLTTIILTTLAWLLFSVYSFYNILFNYEYPFEIQDGGTPAKIKYTLFDRLYLAKTISWNITITILCNSLTLLLVTGVVHFYETL